MRVKSARGLIASATILCIAVWLARWRLYAWLDLYTVFPQNLFLDIMAVVCMCAIALVAGLVQASAQPAPAETQSQNSPALSKEIEDMKKSLREMGEKVADIHAMSVIKQKRDGAES